MEHAKANEDTCFCKLMNIKLREDLQMKRLQRLEQIAAILNVQLHSIVHSSHRCPSFTLRHRPLWAENLDKHLNT